MMPLSRHPRISIQIAKPKLTLNCVHRFTENNRTEEFNYLWLKEYRSHILHISIEYSVRLYDVSFVYKQYLFYDLLMDCQHFVNILRMRFIVKRFSSHSPFALLLSNCRTQPANHHSLYVSSFVSFRDPLSFSIFLNCCLLLLFRYALHLTVCSHVYMFFFQLFEMIQLLVEPEFIIISFFWNILFVKMGPKSHLNIILKHTDIRLHIYWWI